MDKVWRCECCGELMDALNPAWRWTGEVWQHHHPEAMMHYDARPFGVDERDAIIAEKDAELARLRARVAELEAAQAWRPIEEAPRDGRTMWFAYRNQLGNWRITRGQWMTQEYIDEYFEEPELASPGWYETAVEPDITPNCWWIEPSHFMPMPEPPK